MSALRLTRTADRTFRLDGTAGQLRMLLEAYGAQTRKPNVGDFYLLRFIVDGPAGRSIVSLFRENKVVVLGPSVPALDALVADEAVTI
jgi:hypothetical protein